ncbi:hypothetical protein [uncultured Nostoc sp.]|nr:hypothetical protein [uncultured Nostoc sp.]
MGGTPYSPLGIKKAGASLSRMGEDRTASLFQINETLAVEEFR